MFQTQTPKIWLIAIALLLSFLVTTNWHKIPTIASRDSDSGSSNNQNIQYPLVIGYSNWAGWWPWAIAESEGLFAKNNVQVELRWYDNYSDSLKALASGTIDGNSQTLSDTISFAQNAVKGEVIVLVNDNSAGNDKIIAAEGIEQIKDLKAKKVVIEAGVVDDFLLTLALEREGMSRDDVQIIDIETGAAVEAFVARQGDAVGAFPPFWLTALKRKGAREIVSSADFPGAIPDLLVVTSELVEQHPKEVQALIDTWFDVLDFMAKYPNMADEIMARQAGVDPQRLQLFKAGTKMFTLVDNVKAFSKGNNIEHLPYAVVKTSDFLERNFQSTNKKPNLSTVLNSDFIEAKASSQHS
jgi:NitT/TauT family transport system substrate-binding protein